MDKTIHFFNEEHERYHSSCGSVKPQEFAKVDPRCISWSRGLYQRLKAPDQILFNERFIVLGSYRPYCKQWLYSDFNTLELASQINTLFPEHNDNLVIALAGQSAPYDFSALLYSGVFSLTPYGGNSQCLPLYWYEEKKDHGGLFADDNVRKEEYVRHDAITDETLKVFRSVYPNAFGINGGRTIAQARKDGLPSKIANSDERFDVNKVDIFYYVYGVLHSPEYRSRFEANLQKELPRIPLSRNFREFCAAGRALAKLHLGYETIEPWPVKEVGSSLLPGPVQKIKWGKRKDPETGKRVDDHTVLIYNENLVIKDIPEAAQRYTVNGRSPLEWVIDRYQVKTDKASDIVNDPNEYSDDPRYIVDLIEKLIRVSMETMEIVDQLPPVSELPQPANWPFAWKAGQ